MPQVRSPIETFLYGGPLDQTRLVVPYDCWSINIHQLKPWPPLNVTGQWNAGSEHEIAVNTIERTYYRYQFSILYDLKHAEKANIFIFDDIDPDIVENELQTAVSLSNIWKMCYN